MSLLSATWQPLVSAGDFLEPPLAQLHKVFYRKLSAGLEGSASLAAHSISSSSLGKGALLKTLEVAVAEW